MAPRPDTQLPAGDMQRCIDAARRGTAEELGRLLEACRPYLLLIANEELQSDLRAKVGASDLVQETLLKAHQHFVDFHGCTEGHLKGWLRQTLLNHLDNVIRQYHGTLKRQACKEVPEGIGHDVAADTETPSKEVIRQEERAALRRALEQLPDEYRRVIQWRDYDGLSFAEIGARLHGRTADAARKLWTRAVDQLGEILDPAPGPRPPERSL